LQGPLIYVTVDFINVCNQLFPSEGSNTYVIYMEDISINQR